MDVSWGEKVYMQQIMEMLSFRYSIVGTVLMIVNLAFSGVGPTVNAK